MRSACAGALALVAGSGVFANASQTPGRIVFPLVPVASTTSLATPVAPVRADTLDDGRVLIATRAADGSLLLLRLLPSGAPDEAFGVAGTVRLAAGALVGTDPVAVVALSDASAYIVVKPAQEKLFPALSVAHVLANGGLDAGYGRGGVASTAATWRDPLAGWYDPAEVAQSDGRLVLSSASGRPIRLLTDGREDPGFAAPAPTMGSSGTIGAVLSDGRIALIDGIGRLVVLRSDGSIDPGFNAGRPWSTGDVLSALLPGPDGTIDVFGSAAERISSTGNVLREAPLAGAPSAGSLAFREPDGGTLVIAPQGRNGTLLITLDAAFARVAVAPYSPPAFGGAYFQPDVVRHVDWASAGNFQEEVLLAHGDGLLVVGTVGLSDAQMHRHDEIAVAALHSDSTADTSFAGPTTRTQIRAKLVPRHPLAADVTVPRAGALLVQAWDRRHHQVAQGQGMAFTARTLRVRLSPVNQRRRSSRVARYTVSFRDLAGFNRTISKRSLRR